MHHITTGQIEFGCDGLSALAVAFTLDHHFSMDYPSYEIIAAIWKLISQSPVSWTTRHVSGHQDDHKEFNSLDTWERLNVEADALTKEHIRVTKGSTRHYSIPEEPWSLQFWGKNYWTLPRKYMRLLNLPKLGPIAWLKKKFRLNP